jgi:hypothetical protein
MDDQRLIRLLPPYPPTTAKETLRQKMIRQVHGHNFYFPHLLTHFQQRTGASELPSLGDLPFSHEQAVVAPPNIVDSRGGARVVSPTRKGVSFMPAFASRLFGVKDGADVMLDEVLLLQQQQQQHSDKEVEQQQNADKEEIEMLCKLLCVSIPKPNICTRFWFQLISAKRFRTAKSLGLHSRALSEPPRCSSAACMCLSGTSASTAGC